jgi:hypothetical protein
VEELERQLLEREE